MAGYPQNPSGYNYGTPPPSQQYNSAAPPPYGQHQQSPYPPVAPSPYGAHQPPREYNYNPSSSFMALLPSAFPPGTDPNVIACFQVADEDGNGTIDDKELQRSLSAYNQGFSIRTIRLLMHLFTNDNSRKIGPKEFTQVFYSLQNWRAIFVKFDRDRSGQIDASELGEALTSLGIAVSPFVLNLLICKFDRTGGQNKAIEYDNFIE